MEGEDEPSVERLRAKRLCERMSSPAVLMLVGNDADSFSASCSSRRGSGICGPSSSPRDRYRPQLHLEVDGRSPSASSGPSSLSRPFATLSTSPLPPLPLISHVSLPREHEHSHSR